VRKERQDSGRTFWTSKPLVGYAITLLCLAGVVLLVGVAIAGSYSQLSLAYKLQQAGWGFKSAAMAKNVAHAVLHMSAIVAAAGLLLFCGGMGWLQRFPRAWKVVLIGVLLLDLISVDHKYISVYDAEALFSENPLLEKLQQDPEPYRLALLATDQIHYDLASTSLARGGIQHLDMFVNWRMPGDEVNFATALHENRTRMWELCNARYIISDAKSGFALIKDPHFAGMFEPVLGFNIGLSARGLGILRPTELTPPQHLLFRFKKALPRAAFYRHWEVIPSATDMLRRLGDKVFDPSTTVLLPKAPGGALVGITNSATPIVTCEVVLNEATRVEVRVPASGSPGLLVLNDKYHPAWEVTVDGNPAALLRCNSLMRGVVLPAGAKEVVFEYRPSTLYVWIGIVSTALILLWGIIACASARHQRCGKVADCD